MSRSRWLQITLPPERGWRGASVHHHRLQDDSTFRTTCDATSLLTSPHLVPVPAHGRTRPAPLNAAGDVMTSTPFIGFQLPGHHYRRSAARNSSWLWVPAVKRLRGLAGVDLYKVQLTPESAGARPRINHWSQGPTRPMGGRSSRKNQVLPRKDGPKREYGTLPDSFLYLTVGDPHTREERIVTCEQQFDLFFNPMLIWELPLWDERVWYFSHQSLLSVQTSLFFPA